MSQFVATTTLSQMRSLGSTAERSVHRLRAVLGREFPGGSGLELAEPVPRRDGAGIDWYTERDEPLSRLQDLPPDTAAFYRTRLYESVQAVLRAAAAHDARDDAASKSTAAALRNAVTFPGDENVWIAWDEGGREGALILTAWGYERHEAVTSGGAAEIAGIGPALPSSEAVQGTEVSALIPPSRQSRWRWAARLLWLVPVALTGLAAWLLLPACGLRLPFGITAFGEGGGAYCALAAPQPAANPDGRRTQELMSEATVLEEQLKRRLASCEPPVPEPGLNPAQQAVERLLEDHDIELDPDETMVTLTWNDLSDLDLHVKCPDGDLVPLEGVLCGATHRVDMNWSASSDPSETSTHPVENVTWGDQPLMPGHYEIYVTLYSKRGVTPQIDFDVVLNRKGHPPQAEHGSLSVELRESNRGQLKVMEFDVP